VPQGYNRIILANEFSCPPDMHLGDHFSNFQFFQLSYFSLFSYSYPLRSPFENIDGLDDFRQNRGKSNPGTTVEKTEGY